MDIAHFQRLLQEVLDEKIAAPGATVAERAICAVLQSRLSQLDQDATLAMLDGFRDASAEIRGKIRAKLMRAR